MARQCQAQQKNERPGLLLSKGRRGAKAQLTSLTLYQILSFNQRQRPGNVAGHGKQTRLSLQVNLVLNLLQKSYRGGGVGGDVKL
jgi:hypothetical protein